MTHPTLHLHDHPVSSYAQKIRIALREKSLPYTASTPANLGSGQKLPDLYPRLEVPCLVVNNTLKIFDSTIILEYLEDAFPETKKLLPRDAGDRAKARMIEDVVDTTYEGINWGYGEVEWGGRADGDGELKGRLVREVERQTGVVLKWLEGELGGADFFGGEEFGWADVCVAPVLNRSVYYGFGPEEGSKLKEWHARVCGRESVRKTFEEMEVGAKGMQGFLKKGFLEGKGERRREYRDHRLEWMIKSGGMDIVLDGLKEPRTIRFGWPDPTNLEAQ